MKGKLDIDALRQRCDEVAEAAEALEELPNEPRPVSKAPSRRTRLIEIGIVLGILLGIQVAIGSQVIHTCPHPIKESQVRLNKISNKIQEFYAFQSPSRLPDDLNELVNPPGGEPAYMKEDDIKDAWGQTARYLLRGRDYELSSAGEDGDSGTADDIIIEEYAARYTSSMTSAGTTEDF